MRYKQSFAERNHTLSIDMICKDKNHQLLEHENKRCSYSFQCIAVKAKEAYHICCQYSK